MTQDMETSGAECRWALIGAPSAAGARRPGQDKAPGSLRRAGLLGRLLEAGLDVVDLGDAPACPFEHPTMTGLEGSVRRVSGVVREVEQLVDLARAEGRKPLLLGGDCTVTLGVLASFRRSGPVGLVYFDADLDLNTPDTSPSAAFDGMVLAHALGLGERRITERGTDTPLLEPSRLTMFGFDLDSGWVDPPEVARLRSLGSLLFPLERVRGREAEAAMEAVEKSRGRSSHWVLHFDVDVTSVASADVPHPNGLDLDAAAEALAVFAAAPECAAVVVTEYNPESDPGGRDANSLVAAISSALPPAERRDRT